jgi:hypothetical protein
MTRKPATVSRLPSGRERGRPKTRLASAVDGSERELLLVLRLARRESLRRHVAPAADHAAASQAGFIRGAGDAEIDQVGDVVAIEQDAFGCDAELPNQSRHRGRRSALINAGGQLAPARCAGRDPRSAS